MPRKGLNGLKALIHWFKINEHNNEEKLKIIARKIIGNIGEYKLFIKKILNILYMQLHIYNAFKKTLILVVLKFYVLF